MWETSLPEEKLAGDLGNVIEATSIRQSSVRFFKTEKLAPGNLGLFQRHRTLADQICCDAQRGFSQDRVVGCDPN
jgi:hypothetical protein